jgi:hypothetical protein
LVIFTNVKYNYDNNKKNESSMKSVLSTFVLIFLTFTINAQSISFNALKEAALGNEDVLKRELIENGWTMEQIDKDDEESYGYAFKNVIGLTSAFIIFSDSHISCRSLELLEDSIYDELYTEIKTNCKYNGVETFTEPPIVFAICFYFSVKLIIYRIFK